MSKTFACIHQEGKAEIQLNVSTCVLCKRKGYWDVLLACFFNTSITFTDEGQ